MWTDVKKPVLRPVKLVCVCLCKCCRAEEMAGLQLFSRTACLRSAP